MRIFSLSSLAAAAVLGASVLASGAVRAEVVQPVVKASLAVLTVSDFFPNAGGAGSAPIFRAPDLGDTGRVNAHVVAAAARAAGYAAAQAGDINEVQVTRMAVTVDSEAVVEELDRAIRERLQIPADHGLDIQLTRPFNPLLADPASERPYKIVALRIGQRSPVFEAALQIVGDGGSYRFNLSGLAIETVDVVMSNRPMRQGDVIAEDDLYETEMQRSRAPAQLARAEDIVGMELSRSIGRGSALTIEDVREPTLVRRGEKVRITYTRGKLVLSVVGEALSNGARGDYVRVLNPQSRRTLEARVVSAGTVEVGHRNAQLAQVEQ